jgi:tRNA A37 threonylcarbamoyltransferase TsaD
MDLSYSGLVTDMERKLENEKDEVVANTFQEYAYSAAVEALERAMSQSQSNEALLTGGVAMNKRLREMVEKMCEERGAKAYFPPPEYCMDNGAMIAHQGLLQTKTGEETDIEESQVKPNWRPDEVEVSWL